MAEKGKLSGTVGIVLIFVVAAIVLVIWRPFPPPAFNQGTVQEQNERIKPLAQVSVQEAVPVAAAATAETGNALGDTTFHSICAGCHASGALGAPKYGSKADWAPRIAQGMDALYHSALNGKNLMPAKGGNPALSDDAVKAAVDYMVAAAR